MQNLLEEKLEMTEILNLFTDGIKNKEDFKVGIEYERLPISNETLNSVEYDGMNGICEFLRTFARKNNWDYILDDVNIIGLKKLHDTITLEPGCQIELSIEPQKKIELLEAKINTLNSQMAPLLDEFNISLLDYGISPISTHKNIKVIPKYRYKTMANYLWGILSDVMMRETAGIQACFDFSSEEDASLKFRVANLLMPFVTAMYANSPIRGGVDTGYKTFRSLAWINTDNERCGFATKFNPEFKFKDYIDVLMETPMIMIKRDNKTINMNGAINFKQFIKYGWERNFATLEDFKLHANLYFPDVRLRKFVEIRNQDCVGKKLQYSILALYKGILYNQSSLEHVNEILSKFNYMEIAEFRYNVPKYALDCEIGKYKVKNLANELLKISEFGLIELNENEEKYLEPIKELTEQGLSPADIILKNWYSSWNKNVSKLIENVNSI